MRRARQRNETDENGDNISVVRISPIVALQSRNAPSAEDMDNIHNMFSEVGAIVGCHRQTLLRNTCHRAACSERSHFEDQVHSQSCEQNSV